LALTENDVAATDPNLTEVAPANPLPVIFTLVPAPPLEGLTPVITGPTTVQLKLAEPEKPALSVAVTVT
jgi:hypothetical protein